MANVTSRSESTNNRVLSTWYKPTLRNQDWFVEIKLLSRYSKY